MSRSSSTRRSEPPPRRPGLSLIECIYLLSPEDQQELRDALPTGIYELFRCRDESAEQECANQYSAILRRLMAIYLDSR